MLYLSKSCVYYYQKRIIRRVKIIKLIFQIEIRVNDFIFFFFFDNVLYNFFFRNISPKIRRARKFVES